MTRPILVNHSLPVLAAALLLLATTAPSRSQTPSGAEEVAEQQPPAATTTAESERIGMWQEAMAAFADADRENPTPPGGVVFVGSSSIRLWDLGKSFPNLSPTPLNRGFGGSHLEDSINNVELLILKHKPRLVVVYAGDNDIAAGKNPDRVVADFQKLTQLVHQRLPETRIAYIAIKPSIARWKLSGEMKQANDRIAELCEENESLEFIDIWTPMLGDDGRPRAELFVNDGLHMSEAGYKIWASLVAPLLESPAVE